MEHEKNLNIKCNCSCMVLSFYKYTYDGEDEGEPEELMIESYSSDFYAKQGNIFSILWDRIKMAYSILTGKKYRFYDIVIVGDDIQKIKEFLK